MRKNYLTKFYEWMIREGRMDKEGLPSEGLSPTTATSRMKKTRRILIDIGYIKRKYTCKNHFIYSFQMGRGTGNIRYLSVDEIKGWFRENFPILEDAKARKRKADYVNCVYKFADFLHFELRQWSKAKVNRLRKEIRRPWVPPVWENKLEILPIEKTDAFLGHLKPISPMHYMMFYLMRHANMRYIEVANVKADLKSGTLVKDFQNDIVIIYGKGRGGLSQRRTTPFLGKDQKEINEFLKWRREQDIHSEWMFVNQYGNRFSQHSGHFNHYLRNKGREYGFCEEEVKLLTSHKVGRHAYGTDMTLRGLPERLLCDNMGIRNPIILTRYQNATDNMRVEETRKCLEKDVSSKKERLDSCVNIEGDDDRGKKLLEMLLEGKIDEDTFKMGVGLMQS